MTTIYAPQNNPENRARLLYILTHRHVGQAQAVKKADLLVEMFGPEAAADKSYNFQLVFVSFALNTITQCSGVSSQL